MSAPSGTLESALGLSNMIPRTSTKLVKAPPKPTLATPSTSPFPSLATTSSSNTATVGKLTKPMPGSSRSTTTSSVPFKRQRSTSTSTPTSTTTTTGSFFPAAGPWTSQLQNPRKVQVFYPRTRKSSHPVSSTPASEPWTKPTRQTTTRLHIGEEAALPRPDQEQEEDQQSAPERIAAMLRRHRSLTERKGMTSEHYPGLEPVPVPVGQTTMIPPPPRGDSIQGVKQKLLVLAAASAAPLLDGSGENREEQRVDVEDGSRGSDASQRTVRPIDKTVQHPDIRAVHLLGDGDDSEARIMQRAMETTDDETVVHSLPPPMFSPLPDLHLQTFFASPPSTPPSRTPIVVSPRTSWIGSGEGGGTGHSPTPPRNYSLPFGSSLKSNSAIDGIAAALATAVPRLRGTGLSTPPSLALRLSAESSETSTGGDSAVFSSPPRSDIELGSRTPEDTLMVIAEDGRPWYTLREPESMSPMLAIPQLGSYHLTQPQLNPYTPPQPPSRSVARPQSSISNLNPPPPPITRRMTRSHTLPLPGAMTTPTHSLPTTPTKSSKPPLPRPLLSHYHSSASSSNVATPPPLFYTGPSIVTSTTPGSKFSSLTRPTTAPSLNASTSTIRSPVERLVRPSTSPGVRPTHVIAPSLDTGLHPVLSHHSQSYGNALRPELNKSSNLQRRHSTTPTSTRSRPTSGTRSRDQPPLPSISTMYDSRTGAPLPPKSVRFSQWSDVRTFVHESWEPKGVMKPKFHRAPAGLSLGMGAEDIILADAGRDGGVGGSVGGVGGGGGNKLSRAGSGKMRSLLGFVTKSNR